MSNNNNTTHGKYTHAKVPLAKPTVHGTHPFKHKGNHEKLLSYLQERLLVGKDGRDQELPRLARIDKKVAGWIKLSEEDSARKKESEDTGNPLMTNMNLPVGFIHLDDMMTFYAQTFAPNRGMFYHNARPGETTQAAQIVTKMNNDAIYSGYFREVLRGIFAALKYNQGGYVVNWGSDSGPKIDKDEKGNDTYGTEVKWRGNRLTAIDQYNFLRDTSVHPSRLHCDGEFAAFPEIRSHFWLQNKASLGAYFVPEEALSSEGFSEGAGVAKYWRSAPVEAKLQENDADSTNWVSILSETSDQLIGGHELVPIYIRLNPTEFGLIEGNAEAKAKRNRYEIWRFTVLNDLYIIEATHMNNIHNHIPAYCGVIHDDVMGTAQRSVAELLTPLQDFASFLLNVHSAASRQALWGLTVYDYSIVDLKKVPKGEVSAYVPVEPSGIGKDLSKAIWQPNRTLDTKQTMSDLESVMGIINQFFPTQALPSQIAGIDRAVTDQVAAVQQGANRRQQKTARLLDDSIFTKVRYAMYYNIIQYQPDDETLTDFYTGEQMEINLSELRDTNLPFIIGQGLKAIDRQASAQMLQQVIFALIQAPAAAQNVDVMGLIDYWTSLIDIDIDMKQFRTQPPAAEGAPPAVDEAGNPIQPATNPQAVTEPVFG